MKAAQQEAPSSAHDLFAAGALVLVTLSNPREKIWGAVLHLTAAGLSMRGIGLESLEDFAGMLRSGEAASASAVFFPMHRIERIELDARNGAIPSIAERFEAKCGRTAASVLGA